MTSPPPSSRPRRRGAIALVAAAAVAAAAASTPQQAMANGCGVPFDVATSTYIVGSADDLRLLSDARCDMSWGVRLTADIDLTGTGEFTPVGDMGDPFTGTFEGGGHTVTGLQVTSPAADGFGLFGYATGATIRDVTVTGTVIGIGRTGGGLLVGNARNSTITGVTVAGTVRAAGGAGGITGIMGSGSLTNATAAVVVTADDGPGGGIAGTASTVGGSGLIRDVRSEGSVVADSSFAGGITAALIGMNLANASSTATVRGRRAGGLVGRSESDGSAASIVDAFSTGRVEGAPSGALSVGGVLGEACAVLAPSIIRTYFAGALEPAGAASGGVVGSSLICPLSVGAQATVEGNLWNSDTAGPAGAGSGVGLSRTTAQMRDIGTYTALGWSIANGWEPAGASTWGICAQVNNGFPYLQDEGAGAACRAPLAPPTPVTPGSPAALAAQLLAPRRRVVSGQAFTVGIRATNSGGATAASATSCIVLPTGLVITRAPGALRSGRTVCFRLGDVAAGTRVTRTVSLRAASVRRVTRVVTGRAAAAGIARVAARPVGLIISPRTARTAVTG